jgi:hypothetical protein
VGDSIIWPWIIWAILTAVGFAILEYRGLRRRDDDFPPLTQVIKHFIPRWAIALLLGGLAFWSFEHFIA